MAADTEERFDASGRYSIKGELLLLLPDPDVHQAESCFQQALTIARHQGAKMPELRAALRLSHLWQQQGKRDRSPPASGASLWLVHRRVCDG